MQRNLSKLEVDQLSFFGARRRDQEWWSLAGGTACAKAQRREDRGQATGAWNASKEGEGGGGADTPAGLVETWSRVDQCAALGRPATQEGTGGAEEGGSGCG